MKLFYAAINLIAMGGLLSLAQPRLHATVNESVREIPIVKEVDVVVIGGSSGAASAAISAAEAGARVFLLAPRSYLGEDMCATLRLWLEEGETPTLPLAKRLFAETTPADRGLLGGLGSRDSNALQFTYTASLSSVTPHKDTEPPTLLNDGVFDRAERNSVQYNGDVEIIADLGALRKVKETRLVLYHREGGDFNPGEVMVAISPDKAKWEEMSKSGCPDPQQGVIQLTVALGASTRYVRYNIHRQPGGKRVLLGEIELIGQPEVSPMPVKISPPKPADYDRFVKMLTPMSVKRRFDEALVEAKVDFLFGSFPTELLVDAQNNPCGVIMANRSGRQAVLAKVIIDATPRATVARMAGAQFQPYPAGEYEFKRVVVGGEVQTGPKISGRKLGLKFSAKASKTEPAHEAELIEYTLRLPMKDGSFASFSEAEQMARDLTWYSGTLDASDNLFQVPPDAMRGKRSNRDSASTADTLDLDVCRPYGSSRIYVLGGCVDVPRDQAARILRPLALMNLGAQIGAVAAKEASSLPAIKGPKVASGSAIRETPKTSTFPGEVKEFLNGLRPTQRPTATLTSPARNLPVLGVYDVVVVGGGTGGAPAGIGAARGGAKTLVLEYQHGLGGVGTVGMISLYYYGFWGGFTAEVDKGVAGLHGAKGIPRPGGWEILPKMEWWRQANRKAGAEMWFGVLGCGAFMENNVVKGVVVVTPEGRGIIIAKTVIDATGNADVAAAAGAKCTYTDGDDVGVQGTGLPPRELGAGYTNTDYMFADDTDVVDFWHQFILSRQKFKNAYDLGQLVDTRERRRIVGDVTISPMDIILNRTWPDSIVLSKSNFDSHGFTVHPVFVAMPPDKKVMSVCVPLRALLPQGIEGVLVTGLGVSAHRDAMPVIRMQPDIQNQGYACGKAAAMVANTADPVRKVDIKQLQKHLVEIGSLPESTLTDQDSLPMPKERIAEAIGNVIKKSATNTVDGVVHNREALAVLFAQPRDSIPMLAKAHASATGDAQLAYAHILAMMGDASGASTLLERIKSAKAFDTGWNFRGGGQYGRSLSELDSYIVALGRTRHPQAFEVIAEKARTLDASQEFSHHRACAMAFETIGDRRAVDILFQVMKQPGILGYATADIEEARSKTQPGKSENRQRSECLREIVLARALYRCGDKDGLGEKVLRQYASDLRGHYARHAQAVLDGGKLTANK